MIETSRIVRWTDSVGSLGCVLLSQHEIRAMTIVDKGYNDTMMILSSN